MKFLVIAQDLRISGTSEGVVSRSFLVKLRKCFPDSNLDVLYLKHHQNLDQLELLPVDNLEEHFISTKVPFPVKMINWIYWRLFHQSLNDMYIERNYRKILKKVDSSKYDLVFIRSSGIQHEIILSASGLSFLSKAVINFHDVYPFFWDTGSNPELSKLELMRLRKMWKVVMKAKKCMSPSKTLSQDMQFLYGSSRKFFTLPHQFDQQAFPTDEIQIRKKEKPICISYHGAIQLFRNMDIVLDAYLELINEHGIFKETTEFVLRIRGSKAQQVKEKYKDVENIIFLDIVPFRNSAYEQANETDIIVILENCSTHSNILVGKSPFLASLEKPVLSISPERSELREIIKEEKYIASCTDFPEVKFKLRNLIEENLKGIERVKPFGDYFSDFNFKKSINNILTEKETK
jgi:hypothetical protein